MSKALSVAWREFKQTVLRKVFLLAVLGIPVLGVGAIVLAVAVMRSHEQPPLVGVVAVVDESGEVAAAARTELSPQRIAEVRREQQEALQEQAEALRRRGLTQPPATFDMGLGRGEVHVEVDPHEDADDIEALKQRVRDDELLAVAVIPPAVLDVPDAGAEDAPEPTFELFCAESLDADHASFLERRLGDAIVRVRARRAGLEPDRALAMLRRPESQTRRVLPGGQETAESADARQFKEIVPMVFMMLLWVAVFSASQHLMMSTIEEKSNRVMEVLLSAVSPLQLMTGKILGHGFVGLLIVVIYASLAVAGLVAFALMHWIQVMDIVHLFVFFFMAYFMIAAIMGAVGSAVTDIREANTLVTPVMFIVMIPLVLWLPISEAPNGTIATVFSFVPPAIPFVMILRLAADEAVPAWQVPATIVWGYACVVGMVWLAAKIFRIGVLMYGKPPTPLQLLKWVRYG